MLDYNGYSIKKNGNETIIRKNRSDSGCLIAFVFIGGFILVPTFIYSVVYGAIGLVAGALVFLYFNWILSKKYMTRISSSKFKVDNGEYLLNWRSTEIIEGIYTHSKFVDEYASAFKSTSKEHQVTIGLRLTNNQLIPIFRLISDHAQPSKEMQEVVDYVETLLKQ